MTLENSSGYLRMQSNHWNYVGMHKLKEKKK